MNNVSLSTSGGINIGSTAWSQISGSTYQLRFKIAGGDGSIGLSVNVDTSITDPQTGGPVVTGNTVPYSNTNMINRIQPTGVFGEAQLVMTAGTIHQEYHGLADLNGDRKLDILHRLNGGYLMNLLLSGPGNAFSLSDRLNYRPTTGYIFVPPIEEVDIDGDGDVDFVWTEGNDQVLYAAVNDGDGDLQVAPIISSFQASETVYTDLNRDGAVEVVTVVSSANGDSDGSLGYYKRVGPGLTFQYIEISSGLELGNMNRITAGDLNGDGSQDVVVFSDTNDIVGVFYQQQGGTYNYVQIASGYNAAGELIVVDMENDGDNDVVSFSTSPRSIDLWRNNGEASPTFTRMTIANPGRSSWSLIAEDLDRDGVREIVVSDDRQIISYKVTPTLSPLSSKVLMSPTHLTAAASLKFKDFDGDGDKDIILTGRSLGVIAQTNENSTGPLSVVSVRRVGPAEAWRGSWLTFDIEFNKPIINFSSSDISLTATGVAAVLNSTYKAANTTYSGRFARVIFPEVTATGTVSLLLNSGQTVTDYDGNTLVTTGSEPIEGYVVGAAYPFTSFHTRYGTSTTQSYGFTGLYLGNFDNDPDVEMLAFGGTHSTSNAVDRVLKIDFNGTASAPTFTRLYSGAVTNTAIMAGGVGDLNNDGIDDWCATQLITNTSNTLICQLGPSFSTTYTVANFPNTTSFWARSVQIGDFDSNGTKDIYVMERSTLQNPSGSISIYRYSVVSTNPTPTFAFIDEIKLGTYTSSGSFSMHDMDGDGDKDLVFAGDTNGLIGWYEQTGLNSNAFSTTINYISANSNANQSHWVGDYDGDGDTDVYFNDAWNGYPYIVKNLGNNIWQRETPVREWVYWLRTTLWGDIDEDGDRDYVSQAGNGAWTNGLLMHQDIGSGQLRTISIQTANRYQGIPLIAFDIDRDGDLNLVSSHQWRATSASTQYERLQFLRNDMGQ